MATPAQVGGATAATAGLLAAGAYGVSQLGSSEDVNNDEPQVSTFDPNTALEEPYSTSLLNITKNSHLSFIVKPIQANKDWWDWAFKNKYLKQKSDDRLSEAFTELKAGYSEEESVKTLSKACDTAYKSAVTEYKINDGYLLQNIGDFCTKGESFFDISEPKSLFFTNSDGNEAAYKHGVLSVEENKTKLVKKDKTNHNDLWWQWAFKNLFGDYKPAEGSPFKHVTQGYKDEAASQDNNETALNHACDAAYKKDQVDLENNNSKLLEEISKFCSAVTPKPTLSLPIEPSFILISEGSNASTYSTGLASANGNKARLVDPAIETNQKWFEWSFNKRLNIIQNKETALPDPFKTVDKGYETINGGASGSTTSLNKACKEAYSKNQSQSQAQTASKTFATFVKDFCSPKREINNLTIPSS